MLLEFSKAKDGEKNLLPGNLKELHFWAQSLESCKSIQWGDPTDLFLLFSPAGGFGMLRLLPGVLLTLPCVQGTPGLIHLQFRFKLGVFRAFPPLFVDKHSWPKDEEEHQSRKVCFADSTWGQQRVYSEIFWVYSEILWVCSEILSTTLLKIALGH